MSDIRENETGNAGVADYNRLSAAVRMEPNETLMIELRVFNLRGEVDWGTKGPCTRIFLNTFFLRVPPSQAYLTPGPLSTTDMWMRLPELLSTV
jgi:hypothetical protein